MASSSMASANPISRRVVAGKVAVRVHLLDNYFKTLLCTETTTADDVIDMMVRKLGFEDGKKAKRYFALYESNGVSIGKQIAVSDLILPVQERCSKIVFKIKLFMHSLFSTSDQAVVRMTYIQAVHAVVSEGIQVSKDKACELAAIQLAVRFGDHDPDIHLSGFITDRIFEYVPRAVLRENRADAIESEVYRFHQMLDISEYDDEIGNADDDFPLEAENRRKTAFMKCYVATLREYSCCFGAARFSVTKQYFWPKLPNKLIVAITYGGILILKPPRMNLMKEYKLKMIYRWGFKPKVNFYFQLKKQSGGGEDVFTFETEEGRIISDLLTEYAIALVAEIKDSAKKKKENSRRQKEKAAARRAKEEKEAEEREKEKEREKESQVAEELKVPVAVDIMVKKDIESASQSSRRSSVASSSTSPARRLSRLSVSSIASRGSHRSESLPPPPVPAPPPSPGLSPTPESKKTFIEKDSIRLIAEATENEQKETSNESKESKNDDEALAATKIAALFKGYALRRDLLSMEDDMAAVQLQAAFRGYMVRAEIVKALEGENTNMRRAIRKSLSSQVEAITSAAAQDVSEDSDGDGGPPLPPLPPRFSSDMDAEEASAFEAD